MKKEEANKIIAEFMGQEVYGEFYNENDALEFLDIGKHGIVKQTPYTDSLDALVPVWEKLRDENKNLKYSLFLSSQNARYDQEEPYSKVSFETWKISGDIKTYNRTIQKAAAIATAKAIQGIEV